MTLKFFNTRLKILLVFLLTALSSYALGAGGERFSSSSLSAYAVAMGAGVGAGAGTGVMTRSIRQPYTRDEASAHSTGTPQEISYASTAYPVIIRAESASSNLSVTPTHIPLCPHAAQGCPFKHTNKEAISIHQRISHPIEPKPLKCKYGCPASFDDARIHAFHHKIHEILKQGGSTHDYCPYYEQGCPYNAIGLKLPTASIWMHIKNNHPKEITAKSLPCIYKPCPASFNSDQTRSLHHSLHRKIESIPMKTYTMPLPSVVIPEPIVSWNSDARVASESLRDVATVGARVAAEPPTATSIPSSHFLPSHLITIAAAVSLAPGVGAGAGPEVTIENLSPTKGDELVSSRNNKRARITKTVSNIIEEILKRDYAAHLNTSRTDDYNKSWTEAAIGGDFLDTCFDEISEKKGPDGENILVHENDFPAWKLGMDFAVWKANKHTIIAQATEMLKKHVEEDQKRIEAEESAQKRARIIIEIAKKHKNDAREILLKNRIEQERKAQEIAIGVQQADEAAKREQEQKEIHNKTAAEYAALLAQLPPLPSEVDHARTSSSSVVSGAGTDKDTKPVIHTPKYPTDDDDDDFNPARKISSPAKSKSRKHIQKPAKKIKATVKRKKQPIRTRHSCPGCPFQGEKSHFNTHKEQCHPAIAGPYKCKRMYKDAEENAKECTATFYCERALNSHQGTMHKKNSESEESDQELLTESVATEGGGGAGVGAGAVSGKQTRPKAAEQVTARIIKATKERTKGRTIHHCPGCPYDSPANNMKRHKESSHPDKLLDYPCKISYTDYKNRIKQCTASFDTKKKLSKHRDWVHTKK